MKNILPAIATIALVANGASAQYLRVNHAGYLENDIKAAVYMGETDPSAMTFVLSSPQGGEVKIDSVVKTQAWEPHSHSARIYFSSATTPGTYTLDARVDGKVVQVAKFYIGDDAYSRHALNELPLVYLRQQRCGFNPTHNEECHKHDGILVLAGDRTGEHVDVAGGWHDASDYLQYLTTSANTVYQMLFAYRENPGIWADSYDATGRAGANGIPDILDEARWGLEWMIKMNPNDSLFLNQIADDRDHRYAGTPAGDNVDYGWGQGGARPVYPCIGHPAGLDKYKNESWGLASSVGKFASSFGLGSEIFADIDSIFANELARRSEVAYKVAEANPGACQTCSTVSPYYYEEDNWGDDMELAAMALYRLTGDKRYITEAANYGRLEPVTPWMGADSARHYQWYPFVNLGHAELARLQGRVGNEFTRNMRSGLARVADRASDNAFKVGIPFIWCSNNLAVALVTQAMLYREATGDNQFRELETSARDWLFGVNPWGQTMIILPEGMVESSPRDPHSAMSNMSIGNHPGRDFLVGGLVDGPVYTTIFDSLWGVNLRNEDRFEMLQNSTVVYHDDYSDYSTNEPTMDGTASLTFMLGRLCSAAK
ncbi:MAG: glycoside hydrolase family 9 protein [Odoribacter sp.]|nr:glycoside hydrolase family 9 protein [Odoribacter sp.]